MTVREAISAYYRSIRLGNPDETAAVLAGPHGSAVRENLSRAGKATDPAVRKQVSAAGTVARWGYATLAKEARERGLSPALVRNRMIQGWPRDKALSTPVRVKKEKA